MPTLFIRCPTCSTAFPSRIGLSTSERTSLIVNGLRDQCPSCGREDLFYTKDFFVPPPAEPLPSDAGMPAPEDVSPATDRPVRRRRPARDAA
ncbi:MAG TPA: hypothetical protein VMH78_06135 [Thermoplasmata archaeon]|nr:hypothetical protein [Thermoplasmata archaeon]